MASKPVKKPPAKRAPVKVRVPQLSTVRPPSADLDLSNIRLQGQTLSPDLSKAIIDGQQEQRVDGSSTLTLTIYDPWRVFLRSALMSGRVTLSFDRLSYTLVKTATTDNGVTLTFEETAVNLLRGYTTAKKADRANTTRAQFVRSMITEVKEARIPYQIPEVNQRQPVTASKQTP